MSAEKFSLISNALLQLNEIGGGTHKDVHMLANELSGNCNPISRYAVGKVLKAKVATGDATEEGKGGRVVFRAKGVRKVKTTAKKVANSRPAKKQTIAVKKLTSKKSTNANKTTTRRRKAVNKRMNQTMTPNIPAKKAKKLAPSKGRKATTKIPKKAAKGAY